MSAITAFTELQDRAGREVAQSIAAFVEEVRGQDLSQLATKADLQTMQLATKADLQAIKDILAEQRLSFEQKMHDQENRLNLRIQWTAFAQVLTTIGALIALAKLF